VQTADEYSRLAVLAAVARLSDPTITKPHAMKLAKAGMVRPLGKNPTPVYAYVNHGRWIVHCVCNGAELLDGKTMLCGSCGMTSPVKLPGPKTREKIEAALARRPVLYQNWVPGETPAELWAQNIEQGLFPEDM
jgi:hypothetical protein